MSRLIHSFSKFSRSRARLSLLAVAGFAVLMLAGCAGPPYLYGPYSGPYYGGYGPYDDGVLLVGGGGYYGGHHFYGHSFGHGGGHGGGGYHGGGGRGR